MSPMRGGTLYALVSVVDAHVYMPLCTVVKMCVHHVCHFEDEVCTVVAVD